MGGIWIGEARVIRQRRCAPDGLMLTLTVPSRAPIAPGQFCHVHPGEETGLTLRRPFTYWDASPAGRGATRVDLLYAVVGRGTEALARRKPGSGVGYMGPLGVGFTPPPGGTCVFVAGGVGIVPFHLLARRLSAKRRGPRLLLLFGGRTRSMLYGIGAFPRLGVETLAATEDGSRGRKGRVTDLLEDRLKTLDRKNLRLYACGPEGMLDAVIRIAQREGLPCEVSLEKRMACGLGACGACVTKVKTDDGRGWRWSRICREGPAYDAARLVLE